MMRKKIVSLCMALTLCLGLLPATALAVAPIGQVLYVGGVQISSTGYWTTDSDGNVTASTAGETPTDNYISYDAENNVLTLHNATIKNELEFNASIEGGTFISGSAIGVFNKSGNAELTISLVGTNTIANVGKGIFVLASSASTGSSNLTIQGDGSLNASASQTGIWVQSNGNNAALCVENAEVTASADGAVKNGVLVQAKDGSDVSLTVNGGSLTASVNANIWFQFGSGLSGSGTPTVTVSNNAIVRANGGIANTSSTSIQYGTGNGENGGIVWNGTGGTVYGKVTLQEDLTIGEGESLNIPSGASLTIGNDATLTNEGTVTNSGTLTNNGTIDNSGTLTGTISGNAPPSITTTSPLASGTVGTEHSVTLEANNSTSGWSVTSGSLPDGLTLDRNTGLISGTPTTAGTSTFTVKATNDYGSDSKELSITIDARTDVPVTGVTLSQTELSLTEGGTAQLTATVLPETATNRNVTWSSNAPGVATVNSSGKVTAVSAGTATITVTTADGSFTATCTVTVRPDIPPANPNYRITVEATQGGTVTADPTAAKAGTTVTLTPVPDRGYQVGSVAVTDRFGDAVAVTEQADGTYTFTMPNGQVTVTVTFAEAPLPFPDVTEGDWFYDAVRYAYETGLMDGVEDSLFAPNSETTRAQLVTILYRLAGEPEPGGDSGFSDVAAGTWYTDAVAWAAQNGIVNGVSDTEFAPGEDITREQLAAILYRYAAHQGYDVSQRADLSGFGDASSIRSYAQEALSWAHAQGLVLGFEDGSLRPQGTASRAQIAAVLMRFLAAVSAE